MERYAFGFRQHGVLSGDRMCIHLDNTVENLLAMYGCVLAGATIVLAKTSLTEGEIRYHAEDGDCTHIITDEQYAVKVKAAVARLNMKAFFCMGRATGFVSASDFLKLDEQEFHECAIADPRSTVLAVCYTSGTTGMPKGAEITHYNLVACYYMMRGNLPWDEGDIFFGTLPITHVSGMAFVMAALLDGTCCAIVSAKLTPAEILDTVDKYKSTAALFFPCQLQDIVREMRRTGRGMSSMRRIAVGGSVVSPSTVKAARKSFSGLNLLLNVYGLTESCGIITCQPKTGEPQTTADVGVPLPGVQIKVVDVSTRQKLSAHQTGEICFRTFSMVRGYYKRPKETAELFDEEGWCLSGDAGYYDDDGRLYIFDRLKQMIKCMDKQVVPVELEDLLLRQHADEIAEVCVVGLPHSDYGEAPAAAIVLTENGCMQELPTLAERIKDTVASNLAVYKHLYGGVYFVDSFPKTETGKVNRTALARSLLSV
ncbi:uncharacterized protein [Dermacentor albipictus]|uniref:uncharacterized protein isoform X1 n=1 Tax=Dermacentor albipictus TaxID=60249 RepID=UPI0031FD36B7